MARTLRTPISVALIDDYEIVVKGLTHMFKSYRERIEVLELNGSIQTLDQADILIYDSFAQPEANHEDVARLIASPKAKRVVVYTWNFHPELVEAAFANGAAGYLSKALPARDLVESLELVWSGETVTSEAPTKRNLSVGLEWPGRVEGLSERESEILALITQGKSNLLIAELTYLSVNSVKSYIRTTYKKINARNRVEAVLWGLDHGFKPSYNRIDQLFAAS